MTMKRKPPIAKPAVGAAEFKARCLELMDRVRETREELVVAKHGQPVAKLVPYDPPDRPASFWGSMSGTVVRYDAPFDPVPGEWFHDTSARDDDV
jgi:prevent-host-death family protein